MDFNVTWRNLAECGQNHRAVSTSHVRMGGCSAMWSMRDSMRCAATPREAIEERCKAMGAIQVQSMEEKIWKTYRQTKYRMTFAWQTITVYESFSWSASARWKYLRKPASILAPSWKNCYNRSRLFGKHLIDSVRFNVCVSNINAYMGLGMPMADRWLRGDRRSLFNHRTVLDRHARQVCWYDFSSFLGTRHRRPNHPIERNFEILQTGASERRLLASLFSQIAVGVVWAGHVVLSMADHNHMAHRFRFGSF